MKGVYVNASLAIIERIHKTPHYRHNFYENLQDSEVDYNEIINFLMEGRGTWVWKSVTNEPLQFQQSTMTPETKMWMSFINVKIFPTQHVTKVTYDRALLLYSILQG